MIQFFEELLLPIIYYFFAYTILIGLFSLIFFIYKRRKFTKGDISIILELANPEGIMFVIGLIALIIVFIRD